MRTGSKMGVTKNQQITLDVTGFTAGGSGVGHYEGMAVFVAGAAAGDRLLCHVIKMKKNYAIAKIVKIIKPSKARVEPDCGAFPRCGGCVYRHIKYSAELELKQRRVVDAFERIGRLKIEPEGIIGAVNTDYYRNKAQYPVRAEDGEVKIGFFAERSHRVINCPDCRLQPPEFYAILAAFAEWIKTESISVYDEETGAGELRHIYIRKAFSTGEIMACAVINGSALPKPDALTGLLLKAAPMIKSVAVNYNTEDTNVILGDECEIFWGGKYIEDILCGLRVRLSPLSFYQVNHAQTERLYAKAAEYAGLSGEETVLDLYCGAGTIGLYLAGMAKRVIGVEIAPEAVENAVENARINGIKNAGFICGDAGQAAEKIRAEGVRPDIIVLDPPRKGCAPELLETVSGLAPERIVYVSCDPATLARDCAIMREKGYEVKKLCPVDMFPRTAHVETITLLQRRDT